MVFIDADKTNYINYYKFLLNNNLLRVNGVICVDNCLYKGRVYLQDSKDENGLALREFNEFVSKDPRVEQVYQFFKSYLVDLEENFQYLAYNLTHVKQYKTYKPQSSPIKYKKYFYHLLKLYL